MSEVCGRRLDEAWDLHDWEAAAASLAAFQIESITIADVLLVAGCSDVQDSQLVTMIDPFLSAIEDLMAAQKSCPPRILTNADLNLIAMQLRKGCDRLRRAELPPCLVHGDLNPGNILVDCGHAVILDWAQAKVGHPFYACEYLLAVLRRLRPDLAGWTGSIWTAYLRPWRKICSAQQIEHSLEWTPLMAPFAYALQVLSLSSRGGRTDGYAARLLRSLARRLHDESVSRSMSLVGQS
jgi:serine/threonine protein kinase